MPTALITGATSGIGAGFARHLAAEGHDLVIVARDGERLEAARATLEQAYSVRVEVLLADLADPAGTAVVGRRLADPDRPIDVLVNNAGIGLYRAFGKAELADELRMLDVNVRAVVELCHAAVAPMKERGRGLIINIASVGGIIARPETTTYGASKAYVISFSESLGTLLRDTGVEVCAVCPGFTHTEFHERARVDMSYLPEWMWLDVDEVVAIGLADARKGKRVSVPSLRYKALVAVARLSPRAVVRRMGSTGRPRTQT